MIHHMGGSISLLGMTQQNITDWEASTTEIYFLRVVEAEV